MNDGNGNRPAGSFGVGVELRGVMDARNEAGGKQCRQRQENQNADEDDFAVTNRRDLAPVIVTIVAGRPVAVPILAQARPPVRAARSAPDRASGDG